MARLQGMGPDLRMKAKAELAAALGRARLWGLGPSAFIPFILTAFYCISC